MRTRVSTPEWTDARAEAREERPRAGLRAPQRDEGAAQGEAVAVHAPVPASAVGTCGHERGLVGRVQHLLRRSELGELAGPPGAHRLDELLVAVVDEVGERRGLAVLLPHEEQRNAGGQQEEGRGQLCLFGRDQGHQPVTSGAVADLVVVLGEEHEALGRDVDRGGAVVATPEIRVFSLVDEALVHGPGDVVDRAEVPVVPGAFAGDGGVQRVVEVVVPLAVHPEAAGGRRP